MEKLMTEVDLSGNKTFRLQLKRLLSKGPWGSRSFTLDDDVERDLALEAAFVQASNTLAAGKDPHPIKTEGEAANQKNETNETNETKERLLSFAEYAKDAQPEVLVTLLSVSLTAWHF